jgi:hypothetical protein
MTPGDKIEPVQIENGDEWRVKLPDSKVLTTVNVREVTPKCVKLSYYLTKSAWTLDTFWYDRRDIKFIEKITYDQ